MWWQREPAWQQVGACDLSCPTAPCGSQPLGGSTRTPSPPGTAFLPPPPSPLTLVHTRHGGSLPACWSPSHPRAPPLVLTKAASCQLSVCRSVFEAEKAPGSQLPPSAPPRCHPRTPQLHAALLCLLLSPPGVPCLLPVPAKAECAVSLGIQALVTWALWFRSPLPLGLGPVPAVPPAPHCPTQHPSLLLLYRLQIAFHASASTQSRLSGDLAALNLGICGQVQAT